MKRTVAAVALAVFCLALLAFFRSRPAGPAAPESTVHRMIDAARRGAVRDYLNCFDGALRRRLEADRRDAGAEAFGRDLRARYADVTGVAITRQTLDDAAAESGEVVLRVETVYRDRNEEQDVRLRRTFGGWRIMATGPARGVVMPIKYGTPVTSPPEQSRTSTVTSR